MTLPLIQKVPRKLEEVLGPQGTDDFVDFLNTAFSSTRNGTMEIVTERFERRLMTETGKIREEMAAFRAEWKTDLADFRAEIKMEIAEFKSEIRTEFANMRSELKSEIAEIHKTMAAQTRWVLAAMVGLTGIFSLIVKL